jgi:hypothetical protein
VWISSNLLDFVCTYVNCHSKSGSHLLSDQDKNGYFLIVMMDEHSLIDSHCTRPEGSGNWKRTS